MSFYSRLKCSYLALFLAMGSISLSVTGCGTLSSGRGWGHDALYPVDFKKIPRAVLNALVDPMTLVPAAGALAFGLSKWDKKVSLWATEHTPIFGSVQNAQNDRVYLEIPLYTEVVVTALATPSGDDSKDWITSKLKGLAVEGAAELATAGVTSLLKDTTGRTRPNGGGHSFPSGEASAAFSSVTLSNRNLDSIEMPQEIRIPIKVANILLGTTVGWARVEAGAHFPSDVLAGAALGNFLSATVHDSFMGLPERKGFGFFVTPVHKGAKAELCFTLRSGAIQQSSAIYRSLMTNERRR